MPSQRTQFPLPVNGELAYDPIGAHVVMRRRGRELLGEVVGVYQDDTTKAWLLRVRHFNGASWPVEPNIGAVEVLVRDYDND